MKTLTHKLNTLFTFLIFLTNISFAQTKLNGSLYDYGTDDYISIKYIRKYLNEGNNFITKYTIYHPSKGYEWILVTVTHNTIEKKIDVSIDDANGGIFAHINDEVIEYQTASLKPMGIRGMVGKMTGNRVPNQIMGYFISDKFENVNIAHVLASEKTRDINSSIYFILDEEIKQTKHNSTPINKLEQRNNSPNAIYKGSKNRKLIDSLKKF